MPLLSLGLFIVDHTSVSSSRCPLSLCRTTRPVSIPACATLLLPATRETSKSVVLRHSRQSTAPKLRNKLRALNFSCRVIGLAFCGPSRRRVCVCGAAECYCEISTIASKRLANIAPDQTARSLRQSACEAPACKRFALASKKLCCQSGS